MFELHPRLQQDCHLVGQFGLCSLLMMRDANYPWFILVPRREAVSEIHHLEEADQLQLQRESVTLAAALESVFKPDKLNVAALGNIVPQLHLHHVVRYRDDAAWPDPVWGRVPPLEYPDDVLKDRVGLVREALATAPGFSGPQ